MGRGRRRHCPPRAPARPPRVPSARCPCHLLGVDTVCPPLPQRTWRLRGASPATGSGSQGRCQQGCDWSHKGVTPEPAFPRPAALGPVSDRGWGSQASCSSAAETRWPRQRGAFRIKGPRPHGGSWNSVCCEVGTGREAPWTGPCWAVVLGRPRGLRRGAARRGGGAGGSHGGGGGKGGQLGGLERGAWGPLRLSRPRKASAEPCCPRVGEGSPLHAALLPETLGAASPCRLVPATSPLGTHFSPPPWPPDDVATVHTWRLPAGERAPVTSPL